MSKEASSAGCDRLPPGQYVASDFPVLHVGDVPAFDPAAWRLRVTGAVESPLAYTWDEFARLPVREVTADIHCVTRWSKFGTRWAGVPVRYLIAAARVRPEARYLISRGAQGYSANLPLDAVDDDVLLAHTYEGRPLEPIHGGPVRMFVPSRYFWKSTKWCTEIEFRIDDEPGFWETRGYHNNADPWREERYGD